MTTPFTIRIEPAGSPVAQALIAALDAEIMRIYPGDTVNGIDAERFEASGGVFVVCSVAGEPVACGAIRVWEEHAEVKRMYVAPAFRGRGLGRQVLRYIENLAVERGFTEGVLETGGSQPAAEALYKSEGWTPRGLFGPYTNPASTCFEKRLAQKQ